MTARDELLLTVAPDAARKLHRLEHAIRLLKAGTPPAFVRLTIKRHHQCSRMTAWRVVEMARDLVEG